MNLKIQPIIKTVQGMPFPDQLEILREITRFMSVCFRQSDAQDKFWHTKTLAEHMEANPVDPVRNIDDLFSDFWPEDETADDFIRYTYSQREEDKRKG